MKFNFDDAVNVVKELAGIIYDVAQDWKFASDNREALSSKNTLNISNRLDMTIERYKVAITIFFTINEIADEVAPVSPTTQRKPRRMSECDYCPRYDQQDSIECKKYHHLAYFTDMIPIYAVIQKAGENGIDWGVNWLIERFVDENSITVEAGVKIKEIFNVRRNRLF